MLKDSLVRHLRALVEGEYKLPVTLRAEAGRLLGGLGDPRPGVTVVKDEAGKPKLFEGLKLPKPDGQTVLYLTPLEFLDKLAALIPPPRKHRHRYCPAFWRRLFRRERNRTAERWS